jgi:hypothetical protein
VRPERLGKFKNYLIGNRTRDLPGETSLRILIKRNIWAEGYLRQSSQRDFFPNLMFLLLYTKSKLNAANRMVAGSISDVIGFLFQCT